MIYYTIVEVLMYIVCVVLVALLGISVYKSEKVCNKVSGMLLLIILLMRLFTIR